MKEGKKRGREERKKLELSKEEKEKRKCKLDNRTRPKQNEVK